jgi:hypothetical protein
MQQRYDQAENVSPRSGSSKRVAPVIWGAIILVIVAVAIYFAMKA